MTNWIKRLTNKIDQFRSLCVTADNLGKGVSAIADGFKSINELCDAGYQWIQGVSDSPDSIYLEFERDGQLYQIEYLPMGWKAINKEEV